ncbi:MAG: pilus assembly protein MshP [Gammaproteobacteria bacterium]|nr:pilus assembly protein MshP [Gammaproteobacteria bacterium]NNF60020.1 pilus assembly protein MshP [Gammaproteobacteria bacterium]NNM20076.1 pilus assembly protein MshP [Gammaproteobacteria bacterium]
MNRQRGAALVVAVFLIIVLALLGTVAVKLTGVQQQTVSLSLLSERALQAARTGLEWGAHQASSAGVCLNSSTTLTEAALNGFTVDVSCSTTAHAEGAAIINVYVIESFASAGSYGQPDYVSRRLTMVLTDAT